MRIVASVVVLLVGCLETQVVTCDDDRLCPAGKQCVAGLGLCVDDVQLTACQDTAHVGGAACAAGSTSGICYGAEQDAPCVDCVCVAEQCGDGLVTGFEDC